jgi:hypothetical protein
MSLSFQVYINILFVICQGTPWKRTTFVVVFRRRYVFCIRFLQICSVLHALKYVPRSLNSVPISSDFCSVSADTGHGSVDSWTGSADFLPRSAGWESQGWPKQTDRSWWTITWKNLRYFNWSIHFSSKSNIKYRVIKLKINILTRISDVVSQGSIFKVKFET